MPKLWITYAWADNEHSDVDYVAQELRNIGINVKLDRWDIGAGRRLWEQIERFIQSPSESDGWMLFASQHSLNSEPCQEEYAYAVDRALKTRSGSFPLIGLFSGAVDTSLVPASIRVRLCVSTLDTDWKERVLAAVEGRQLNVSQPVIQPYHVKLHHRSLVNEHPYAVEIRPRAGTWSPFFAAVPEVDKGRLRPFIAHGPANLPPEACCLYLPNESTSDDGQWFILSAQNEATVSQSYYLFTSEIPERFGFGNHRHVSGGDISHHGEKRRV